MVDHLQSVIPVPARDPVVFEDVSIGFNGLPVLDSISFRVRVGETRILLGPAGVGKSVLLKLANGLLRPDSGQVFLFGQDITAMNEEKLLALRTRTGMVFQEGALFVWLTIRDNVGYQLMEQHLPAEEVDERVRQALRFVELERTYAMLPASLSGGMRRRVAIARAIINQPELLIYDSPTGGLDPVTSHTINALIVKERDVYHTPALLVTHRLLDAFTLATNRFDLAEDKLVPLAEGQTDPLTTFLILHEGKIVFDGSTAQLIESRDPFIQAFIA